MREKVNCQECSNYVYDEERDYFSCSIPSMDEDDMARAMQGILTHCPFYLFNDDYTLSRRQ